MAIRKKDTLLFAHPPVIAAWAAVGGRQEAKGPLAPGFDELVEDASFAAEGCRSWEAAESTLQSRCVAHCLRKGGVTPRQLTLAFAGDLQAQCTASNYTMRALDVPYAGVYGACSTMAETLALAAAFATSGYSERTLALSSSHFCAAERQFRTPLDYGGKRTPTAQWTATASGACLVRPAGTAGVRILSATFGRVRDYAVRDINNMGAAMMPAAASTLLACFAALGTAPQNYDAVLTGDLGKVGSALLEAQMAREGFVLDNHLDCGCLLYDLDAQPVGAGGSGAGCSAAVLGAYVLPRLQTGQWRRVLFLATGALMSQATVQQGETIPGIAHAVELAAPDDIAAGEGKA